MQDKKHRRDELDIPLGLTMAVSQNPYLLDMFSSLSASQKSSLVGKSQPQHENKDEVISGEPPFDLNKLGGYHKFD